MGKLSSAAKKLMQENDISRDSLENFAGRLESFANKDDSKKDLKETSEEILEESKKLNKTADDILEALKPSLDDLEADREKKSIVRDLSKKNSGDSEEEMSPNSLAAALAAGFLFGDKLIGTEVARKTRGKGKGHGRPTRTIRPRITTKGWSSWKGSGTPIPPKPPVTTKTKGWSSWKGSIPEPPVTRPPVYSGRGPTVESLNERLMFKGPTTPFTDPILGRPPSSSETGFAPGKEIAPRTIFETGPVLKFEPYGYEIVETRSGIRYRGTLPGDKGQWISEQEATARRTARLKLFGVPEVPLGEFKPLDIDTPGPKFSGSPSFSSEVGLRPEPIIESTNPRLSTGKVPTLSPAPDLTGEGNNILRAVRYAAEPVPKTSNLAPKKWSSWVQSGKWTWGTGTALGGPLSQRPKTLEGVIKLAKEIADSKTASPRELDRADRVLRAARGLRILAVVGTAFEVVSIAYKIFRGENVRNEVIALVVSIGTGGIGAYIGGLIGTAALWFIPGLGTVIGAAIGAYIGAVKGAQAAEFLADLLLGEEPELAPAQIRRLMQLNDEARRRGVDPSTIAADETYIFNNTIYDAESGRLVLYDAFGDPKVLSNADFARNPKLKDLLIYKPRISNQIVESRAAVNTELSQGSSGQGVTVNVNPVIEGSAQNAPAGVQTYRGGGTVNNVLDTFTDPVGWVN